MRGMVERKLEMCGISISGAEEEQKGGERKKVAVAVGVLKGNSGDGRDQAGVLDEGSGDVWPRPEEVSYATPSREKVTLG